MHMLPPYLPSVTLFGRRNYISYMAFQWTIIDALKHFFLSGHVTDSTIEYFPV